MRVSVEGGTPQPVPIAGKPDEFGCAQQPGSRCVLRSMENGQFVFYDLDPIRGQGRELARAAAWNPITHDWDISPDGSQVAIPSHDRNQPKITIVPLRNEGPRTSQKEINLQGRPRLLNGVVWSADGKGLFVAFRGAGSTLDFADLQGQTWELLTSPVRWPIFAVPSRDGKHLAFPQHIASGNVWLLRGLGLSK